MPIGFRVVFCYILKKFMVSQRNGSGGEGNENHVFPPYRITKPLQKCITIQGGGSYLNHFQINSKLIPFSNTETATIKLIPPVIDFIGTIFSPPSGFITEIPSRTASYPCTYRLISLRAICMIPETFITYNRWVLIPLITCHCTIWLEWSYIIAHFFVFTDICIKTYRK